MINPAEITDLIIFSTVSLAASVSDMKKMSISSVSTATGTAVILSVKLLFRAEAPEQAACGILTAPLLFMTVRIITGGKLGMGDVKFSALMGVFLGFPGWITAALLASLSGLLYAVIGMVSGRLDRRSKIPFAPFLSAGSITAFFINPYLIYRVPELFL